MSGASDSEAREFAAAFRSFLDWLHSDAASERERNEVAALVQDFLGEGAAEQSVGMPPLRLSAPPLVDLPNGPVSTLACLQRGLLLVTDAAGRYVVMVNGPDEHDPGLDVEIAGLPVEQAQAVHARLNELRHQLNVYRGQLLEVSATPHGDVNLSFGEVPATAREDVILPVEVLARVERHALGVAAHRDALLAAGQHLKRGMLLYGPPGTGKTHTLRAT